MWPTRLEARRIAITTDDPVKFSDHVRLLVSYTDPTGKRVSLNRLVLMAIAESLMLAGPTVQSQFRNLARDVYRNLVTQAAFEFDLVQYRSMFRGTFKLKPL